MFTTENITVSLEDGGSAEISVTVQYGSVGRYNKYLIGYYSDQITPSMKWADEEIREALSKDYIIENL